MTAAVDLITVLCPFIQVHLRAYPARIQLLDDQGHTEVSENLCGLCLITGTFPSVFQDLLRHSLVQDGVISALDDLGVCCDLHSSEGFFRLGAAHQGRAAESRCTDAVAVLDLQGRCPVVTHAELAEVILLVRVGRSVDGNRRDCVRRRLTDSFFFSCLFLDKLVFQSLFKTFLLLAFGSLRIFCYAFLCRRLLGVVLLLRVCRFLLCFGGNEAEDLVASGDSDDILAAAVQVDCLFRAAVDLHFVGRCLIAFGSLRNDRDFVTLFQFEYKIEPVRADSRSFREIISEGGRSLFALFLFNGDRGIIFGRAFIGSDDHLDGPRTFEGYEDLSFCGRLALLRLLFSGNLFLLLCFCFCFGFGSLLLFRILFFCGSRLFFGSRLFVLLCRGRFLFCGRFCRKFFLLFRSGLLLLDLSFNGDRGCVLSRSFCRIYARRDRRKRGGSRKNDCEKFSRENLLSHR